MTLRPSELALVAAEIARELVGRPVQKVVQPDDRSLLIGFSRRWLAVHLSPRFGRVHLIDEKPPGRGDAAPPFCMLLRKELVGARLDGLTLVAGERACALGFVRGDGRRELRLLFFGAGARAVLVGDEGRVLGAIGARHGATDLPPPRTDGGREEPPPRFAGAPSPSQAIEAHYHAAEEAATREAVRSSALAVARRAVERARRLVAQLEGDLARATAAQGRRRDADLLLAYLADVPRGASEVTLPDAFSDGAPVRIALDPALSAKDNAARLYREQQRMKRGRALVEKRLADARSELERAERRLTAADTGAGVRVDDDGTGRRAPPGAARSPAGPLGRASRGSQRLPARDGNRPRATAQRPPYHRFLSASGAEILVGRDAAKNDELTFHVARGDDLWLHTRDYAGAHVVVPVHGARPVDEPTLLDAATLAVHHSPARNEAQADVSYAPRKLVRKPRGAPPGRVSVAGGKTLRVRMEPDRLARLLATRSNES